jgi:hypothetical protein
MGRFNERRLQIKEGSPEKIGASFFDFERIVVHGTNVSAKIKYADTI